MDANPMMDDDDAGAGSNSPPSVDEVLRARAGG